MEASLATPAQRLGAWLLDALVAGLAVTPINPALYGREPDPALFLALWGVATGLVTVCLVLFDGGPRGATPGKRIVGIRVADADGGGPIGYRRAALRRLGYILGGLVLYAGWILMLFDSRRRQALHDRLARSVVVKAR